MDNHDVNDAAIGRWMDSLVENPNTSIMGLTQLIIMCFVAYEVYKGHIPLSTGLPIAMMSFAGGIGNLLAGDAGRKWRGTNFSNSPAGNCMNCKSRFRIFNASGCDMRGHQVGEKDTCDDWKPVNEIHATVKDS
jgi:hypothetical protein